jgi:hypothetical protein
MRCAVYQIHRMYRGKHARSQGEGIPASRINRNPLAAGKNHFLAEELEEQRRCLPLPNAMHFNWTQEFPVEIQLAKSHGRRF